MRPFDKIKTVDGDAVAKAEPAATETTTATPVPSPEKNESDKPAATLPFRLDCLEKAPVRVDRTELRQLIARDEKPIPTGSVTLVIGNPDATRQLRIRPSGKLSPVLDCILKQLIEDAFGHPVEIVELEDGPVIAEALAGLDRETASIIQDHLGVLIQGL